MIRVHRSIPLLDTGLVATIQYTCPFVDGLYSPFYPPARLLVRSELGETARLARLLLPPDPSPCNCPDGSCWILPRIIQ